MLLVPLRDYPGLDELIQLEAKNMIPVLARIGVALTPEPIRGEMGKNPDQIVVEVRGRGDALVGALRYSREEGGLFVRSLQLRVGEGSLRGLLRVGASALDAEVAAGRADWVRSVVQVGNQRSIRLHERLGFARQTDGGPGLQYRQAALDLIHRLRRF